MKDNRKRWWGILAILFVVFTVIAFAVPFKKTTVFVISYLFGAAAIAVQLYVVQTAFYRGADVKSKFYGFPLARIGLMYLAAQLIASLLFMALAAVVPVWLPLIVFVILLGAAAIGLVAADAVRDEVVRQEVKITKDTSFIHALRRQVEELKGMSQDDALKQQLAKLSDEIRYSDPVSSDALAEIEQELEACVAELRTAVGENRDTAASLCAKASSLLAARNQLCKETK